MDDSGELGTTLMIKTGDCVGNGDSASAEVLSIEASTGFTTRDFSQEDPSLGSVSSTINLDLAGLPDNASINITSSLEPDLQVGSAFLLAALDAGMDNVSIAYTINIEKTNLANGTDIRSATITMVVGKGWVEAHGGVEAVRILRYDLETGVQQVLETPFAGYDEAGRAIFEAVSPDGLSVFGLAGAAVVPPRTPVPSGPVEAMTPIPAVSPSAAPPVQVPAPRSGGNWTWVYILAAGLIVILGSAWFLTFRKKK